jgi:branched-chain amino acid transport system substrate-binding protein
MNNIISHALMIFLIIITIGCTDNEKQTDKIDIIKVGLLVDIDTPGGQPTINAANLRVNQMNKNGGISIDNKRYNIKLIIADTLRKPQESMIAAQKLIFNEKVLAIVGPNVSITALAASAVAEHANVPLISPGSTNQEITRGKNYIYQIAYNNKIQGQHLAEFAINELKIKRASIVYNIVNPASRTVAESFRDRYQSMGGTIGNFVSYVKEQENLGDVFDPIFADKPGLILLPNNNDAVIGQTSYVSNKGYKGVILGSDNWSPHKLKNHVPLDGAYFTHHWLSIDHEKGSKSANFSRDYIKEFGENPTSMSALTYDAFSVLAIAMSKSSLTTKSLQQQLTEIADFPGITKKITLGSLENTTNPLIFQFKEQTETLYKPSNSNE